MRGSCRGRDVWMHSGVAPRQKREVGRLGADEPGEGPRPFPGALPEKPRSSRESLCTGPRRTVPVRGSRGPPSFRWHRDTFLECPWQGECVMQGTHRVYPHRQDGMDL